MAVEAAHMPLPSSAAMGISGRKWPARLQTHPASAAAALRRANASRVSATRAQSAADRLLPQQARLQQMPELQQSGAALSRASDSEADALNAANVTTSSGGSRSRTVEECKNEQTTPMGAADGAGSFCRSSASSRRKLLGVAGLSVAAAAFAQGLVGGEALAFEFGISGPRDWLKAQKRKSGQFLLNPLGVAQDRLDDARRAFETAETESDFVSAQTLVRDAALDCLEPKAEGGFGAGVEFCTFRLILKNGASLLKDDDAVRLQALQSLEEAVGSFKALYVAIGDNESRAGVPQLFDEASTAVGHFKASMQAVLDA